MNTADLCTEGRDLLAEWKAWHERAFACYLVQYDNQRIRAWQAYKQHVAECELCRKDEE